MNEQKIVVVTDSAAYIPQTALGDLNIPVIPLWLIWDNERFRDGVDIDPTTFYRRLRDSKSDPTSSQPSVREFVDFFRQVAAEEKADAIVGVFVSSKMSGTVASAQAAQAQLPELNIRIVDSLGFSMSLGFVARAAARAAAAGQSLDEVITAAEDMRERIRFIFVVDTLEYLHRGGRIGGAKRIFGTALKIKPLLHMKDGQIEPLVQVRTKRKAIARMWEITTEWLGEKQMVEATVIDVDCPDEGDAVAKQTQERFGVSTIYRTTVSPVIGAHAGPGGVGLIFYTDH